MFRDLDEIFNLSPKDEIVSETKQALGTVVEENLEITLNLPITKKIKEKSENDLKKYYIYLFVEVIKCLEKKYQKELFIKQTHYTIENGKKSNKMHLHGFITFHSLLPQWSPHGLVRDTVCIYLEKIRRQYLEHCMFTSYARYESPPICCQYTFDSKRSKSWLEYIEKNILQ